MTTGDAIRIEGRSVVLRDPIGPDLQSLAHWLAPGQQWSAFLAAYAHRVIHIRDGQVEKDVRRAA